MKRLVAILVIILILIVLGLLSIWRLSQDMDVYVSRIDTIQQSVAQKQPNLELIAQTREDWEEEMQLLTLFLYHSSLEEIAEKWLEVELFCKEGNYTAAHNTLQLLKQDWEQLYFQELPVPQNVL